MVVPPERTVLAYRSLRMSTSHFMIELYVVSWIPADSIPMKAGWNKVSGHLNRSFPIVITSIRKLVALFQARAGCSSLHFLLKVEGNIAQLYLDITDDFTFGGCGEGVSTFGQDFHEVIGQVTSSQIQTDDGVGKSITFIDWDSVADTITRVKDDTGGTSGSVQGEDGLDSDIHGWG